MNDEEYWDYQREKNEKEGKERRRSEAEDSKKDSTLEIFRSK